MFVPPSAPPILNNNNSYEENRLRSSSLSSPQQPLTNNRWATLQFEVLYQIEKRIKYIVFLLHINIFVCVLYFCMFIIFNAFYN